MHVGKTWDRTEGERWDVKKVSERDRRELVKMTGNLPGPRHYGTESVFRPAGCDPKLVARRSVADIRLPTIKMKMAPQELGCG